MLLEKTNDLSTLSAAEVEIVLAHISNSRITNIKASKVRHSDSVSETSSMVFKGSRIDENAFKLTTSVYENGVMIR